MIKSNITIRCMIGNIHYKGGDRVESMLIPEAIGLINTIVSAKTKRLNKLLPQGYRYHGYTL